MTCNPPNLIAVNGADLVLKGRNRAQFESRLRQQIAGRLKHLGLHWPVRRVSGRIIVDITGERERLDEALAALGEIPGIASYFPAVAFPAEWAATSEQDLLGGTLGRALLELARHEHRPGARFAVRVVRHLPDATVSTQSLERLWGAAILEQTDWEGVDLSRPDCTFHIALYPDQALLYSHKMKGVGGLPAGSSGRVVSLLSGGIDSPVAAYLMARRGCAVECLHFSASYVDRDRAADTPVGKLARHLSRYTQSLTLHVAPYVPFDLALAGKQDGYELMLFRRFMLRTAAALARRRRAAALVTGDSLSQVASQTLDNLVALDAAATLPIFRPLIGLNKQEIISWARSIGTYETSIEPYKDCCALIGRRPKTRAHADRLDALEAERVPEHERLVDTVLDESVTLKFEFGEPAG
ncbi:MAG: tRNA 4-thiouridine(8) synthase ThiI [Gammaproteobacteria bacterium]|nr:tRNA 4-thiouridine(8) synthase ThiI [Gammaproteobacteria bacterium]